MKMAHTNKRVLVIGASGMLGNAVLRLFSQSPSYQVFGSVRSFAARRLLPESLQESVFTGVDGENIDSLMHLFGVVDRKSVV